MAYISIALDVSSNTLKRIVRIHLPQQYKFSRNEVGIDISYNGSKFSTTMPWASKVKLDSTYPADRYDVTNFLVERHNHLQNQTWESQKRAFDT